LLPNAPVELYSPACDGIRNLEIGQRYLVSTKWLFESKSSTSAIWALDGDAARLVRMFPDFPFDERFAQATTLEAALDLMVPGQPPTDSALMPTPVATSSLLFMTLSSVIAVALILSLLHRLDSDQREYRAS
jgi:hypothetical protein